MVRIEVLVIGGGATGSGVARDLALRGREVMLLEKGDFCSGSSGRNHGLLHSGARYAVSDPRSASECAAENEVLKKIAPWYIEDTGGLFLDLDGDGYVDRFLSACHKCRIGTTEISVPEALSLEPSLTSKMVNAIGVADASLDPFGLVLANMNDARENGALVKNYCEVTGLKKDHRQIMEATYKDLKGRTNIIKPEVIVNACGAGSTATTSLVGIGCRIKVDKGSMLVLNGRLVNRVISRLRPPSDGDIVVPNHSSSIIGTTSSEVSNGGSIPTEEEVELLIREASLIVPDISRSRVIRAYSGLRPLISNGDGRGSGRGFQVIDHTSGGADNFISIIGGKLTTYRLMAEKVSDLASRKLGSKESCRTHLMELPGEEQLSAEFDEKELACSCERVSWGRLAAAASSPDVHNGTDLMRRTRAGMGFCQAALCAFKIANALGKKSGKKETEEFLAERWKGIEPSVYGDQLKQEVLKAYLFKTYGIQYPSEEE